MTKRLVYILGVGVCLLGLAPSNRSTAQNFKPAVEAFQSPGCSASDLHNDHDLGRVNPEWKPIVIDPSRPITELPLFSPTILEGFVSTFLEDFPLVPLRACNNPPGPDDTPGKTCEGPDDQMPSEVSEEEIQWNHYTHDFTVKVVPDPAYQHLLASWARYPDPDPTCPDGSDSCHYSLMEVEWDNGSVMKVNDDEDRTWGAVPEFVWPAIGDRVWVEGRWVFDCGHAFVPHAVPDDQLEKYVAFKTEIHPPRALAAFRLNHPALSDSPSSSNYPASWLPVTGAPVLGVPGPTPVPVTEADIFVSGNGGGANDLCMIVPSDSSNNCKYGHTSPVIPVNDRNYVFDIYPPGTDYSNRTLNGNFQVTPPAQDASLQWRVVDHSSELPVHTSGVPIPMRNHFSRGSAAYSTRDGWAVDGAQSIAVSFTPSADLSFGRADLALMYIVDLNNPQPNEVQLALETSDGSGLPSGAILDNWTLTNLPTYPGQLLTGRGCCPVQTITPHQNVALTAGVRYWLVATNLRADGYHHATLWMRDFRINPGDDRFSWASRCCTSGSRWTPDESGFTPPAFDVYAAAPAGVTVDPIVCLLDDSTQPPDQTETGCPKVVPPQPTRLRVILPFKGSQANYFAKSILLGWDDVPARPNALGMRTFKVTLHGFTVVTNGECSTCGAGDWRVFVNVGGQYRYISPLWDRNPDGSNVCHGDNLTNNGNGDCFLFDRTPWYVSVLDGTPIHIAVGGYESDGVDSDFLGARDNRWRYPNGDDPFGAADLLDLATVNDDRIGPYEFDLKPPDYQWILPDGSIARPCDPNHQGGSSFTTNQTKDGEDYKVEFCIDEILPPTPPSSAPLVIGLPQFSGPDGTYISATTPMIAQTEDPSLKGFQYRFHKRDDALPTYSSPLPFPVHWANVDLPSGMNSAKVRIGSANSGDGLYDFQYSAVSSGNLLEPRNTATVILDTTPPVATIVQPASTQYSQGDTLTLNYTVSDGQGSGVLSFTPKMDGATTLPDGTGLASGQTISLSQLSLGTHTFTVDSVDNVNNAGTRSVTFSIVP